MYQDRFWKDTEPLSWEISFLWIYTHELTQNKEQILYMDVAALFIKEKKKKLKIFTDRLVKLCHSPSEEY